MYNKLVLQNDASNADVLRAEAFVSSIDVMASIRRCANRLYQRYINEKTDQQSYTRQNTVDVSTTGKVTRSMIEDKVQLL